LAVATIDPVYTASAKVIGGRSGHGTTSDGVLDVALKSPGAKGDPKATNPEQLFAVGYAACYQSALQTAARLAGEDASESVVQSDVSLGKDGNTGFYGLAVKLTVSIPGMDRSKVEALAHAAHERCPYSRATRGNIEVTITVSDYI
jgi:Ohr subfamily peroxiredoxin